MKEVRSDPADLKGQYAAQVAADLANNAREQERVSAELAVLEKQLQALQDDRALLESIRQAVTTGTLPDAAAPPRTADGASSPEPGQGAAVPAPREKSPAADRARVAESKASPTRPARKKSAKNDGPTLGELILSHLVAQPEPRSAAEISAALGESHPQRAPKATVVRTTVEGLVAKSLVERSKQGSSVFYSALASPPQSRGDNAETAPAPEAPAT
ncbi:BlaI/MecI/CopY family transcriptional regulator [Streptodolium elevatio]